MKLLLDRGAGPNFRGSSRSFSPAYFATINCDIDSLKLLHEKGADFNIKEENGKGKSGKEFYDPLIDILLYHYSGHPSGADQGSTDAICLGC